MKKLRVVLYRIGLQKLANPNIEFITAKEPEELEKIIDVMKPELIVIKDEDVSSLVTVISQNACDFAVVTAEVSPARFRQLTAEGATHVWSIDNWQEEMSSEYRLEDGFVMSTPSEDEKPYVNELPRGTTVIAVGGVAGGSGSTHTSLMLANYLSNTTKSPVAIWEAGPNPCFDFYDYILNGEINESRKRFDKKNITFFKRSVDYRQIKSVAHDFTYLIIDLGYIEKQNTKNLEIFADSDLPVLVGSASEWRTGEIFKFCHGNLNLPQDRWRVALPLANEKSREGMAEILRGRPVFRIPSQTDPFTSQDDADQAIEAILSPVIPKRKRKSFFGYRL